MPHLNRKRPFTHMPETMEPIVFRQDGSYFHRNGDYAGDAREVAVQESTLPEPRDVEGYLSTPILTATGAPAKVFGDDMRLLVNRALKQRMEDYGEPWQGLAHARQFLGITTE